MQREPDQAAPTDWIALVNDRGDLDVAFDALDGWNHFHTDTIRGRIRSLQLRPGEAWPFFERAEKNASQYRGQRNDLRRFYLKVYRFENSLIEETDSDGARRARTAEHLGHLLESRPPASTIASQMQMYCQAVHSLHEGDCAGGKKLLQRILYESRSRFGDEKAGFYVSLAAAHRALGEIDEAERHMEYFCLSIPALSNAFNMGVYAASATAVFRLWGREEPASEWEEFIGRLKLPAKTVALFRERSRRIVERSRATGPIFLF